MTAIDNTRHMPSVEEQQKSMRTFGRVTGIVGVLAFAGMGTSLSLISEFPFSLRFVPIFIGTFGVVLSIFMWAFMERGANQLPALRLKQQNSPVERKGFSLLDVIILMFITCFMIVGALVAFNYTQNAIVEEKIGDFLTSGNLTYTEIPQNVYQTYSDQVTKAVLISKTVYTEDRMKNFMCALNKDGTYLTSPIYDTQTMAMTIQPHTSNVQLDPIISSSCQTALN